MQTMKNIITPKCISIGIIGGGAAGASTAHYLVQKLGEIDQDIDVRISVYEKRGVIGPGLAFQRDNDVLLMNMITSHASLFADEPENFWNWLARTQHQQYSQYVLSSSSMSPNGFVPRGLFGGYLSQMFDQAMRNAEIAGIKLEKKHTEVISFQKHRETFEVITATGGIYSHDYVILCTGNTQPQDFYQLSGHARYINNPYPVQTYLEKIAPNDRVGIIGAQLTATDIAIALAHHGHKGSVQMLSRTAELPSIRSTLEKYQLQYLTFNNLHSLQKKGNEAIRLRDVLRLLRKEFQLIGADWRELLFKSCTQIEACEYFEQGLRNAPKVQHWQWVMAAIDSVIEHYWNALTEHDKTKFMSEYHRNWTSRRVPLPVSTVYKLHALLRSEQLTITSGVKNIQITAKGLFQATFNEQVNSSDTHPIQEFDWIINGTGPSRHIDESQTASIVSNLINAGSATKNPHGGIKVDFESSAVVNDKGIIDHQLYAIGQLACGTYYFVSSLEMISLRARSVAHHVCANIATRDARLDKNALSNGAFTENTKTVGFEL
jgi:uncharacterized NAD(P)/FAD-binding protein YdhS